MYSYQYTQLSHATHETLLVITLVLLFCGFKNKTLSLHGAPATVKAAFPLIILLAIYLPVSIFLEAVTILIISIIVLIGWLLVIAPLWTVTSKTGKIVACILSYPGSFLIGGWPLPFAPGILALPFGWWYPSPFFLIQLNAIGNAKGFASTLIPTSFGLVLWGSIFLGLVTYNTLRKKS